MKSDDVWIDKEERTELLKPATSAFILSMCLSGRRFAQPPKTSAKLWKKPQLAWIWGTALHTSGL